MHDHGEADVADVLRHVPADAVPTVGGAVQLVDAAVILLVDNVADLGVNPDAVRIVPIGGVGIREEAFAPGV